ncbi:hypothetical protein CP03DC29_1282, partial [Chlamydia psittaci 03DC29]
EASFQFLQKMVHF